MVFPVDSQRVAAAYAEALVDFLASASKSGQSSRFLLIGYDELKPYLPGAIQRRFPSLQYQRPEDTGRVLEAFEGRKRSSERMLIHLSRKAIGRFASLITSFKVMDESVAEAIECSPFYKYQSRKDLCSPFDISRWLIEELARVSEDLTGSSRKWIPGGQRVLRRVEQSAQRYPSLRSILHPRNILQSLLALGDESSISVANFLRSLRLESLRHLEQVELDEVNLDEVDRSLQLDARMRRIYSACDTSFRNRLASMGLFLLEYTLLRCAEKEAPSVRFRRVLALLTSRVSGRRVYAEVGGSTYVLQASDISGLPLKFVFVVTKKIDDAKVNALEVLSKGGLQDLYDAWSKSDHMYSKMWQMKAIDMWQAPKSSLAIEVSFPDPLPLEAFRLGTGHSLTTEINKLLSGG